MSNEVKILSMVNKMECDRDLLPIKLTHCLQVDDCSWKHWEDGEFFSVEQICLYEKGYYLNANKYELFLVTVSHQGKRIWMGHWNGGYYENQ